MCAATMPRNYREMPPLWALEEKLELTDEHPSALRIRKNGRFAERRDKTSGFYLVSVDNVVYMAHRIVYYMRTGKCPDRHGVKHAYPNPDLDNRKELIVFMEPPKKTRKSRWSLDYESWA